MEPINLMLKSTSSYCGGAYPPQEVLDELKMPKNFSGTIYIHSTEERSDEPTILKITNGSAEVKGLLKGTYYIFRYPVYTAPESKSNQIALAVDKNREDCIKQRSLKPLTSFEVAKNTSIITDTIHLECDPCAEPMP